MEFIRNLIKFRNEHKIFTSKDFIKSLTFHYDNGQIAHTNNDGYWLNTAEAFFGFIINDPQKRIYVAMNKNENPLNIILPDSQIGKSWHICLDSSIFTNYNLEIKDYIEKNYILNPHALAIFMEK